MTNEPKQSDLSFNFFDNGIKKQFKDVFFEKKEDNPTPVQTFSLEQQMVNYSNEVLGIKVMSVALPPNYNPELRNEEQVIDWLKNSVKNKNTSAYLLAKKYDESLKIEFTKPLATNI